MLSTTRLSSDRHLPSSQISDIIILQNKVNLKQILRNNSIIFVYLNKLKTTTISKLDIKCDIAGILNLGSSDIVWRPLYRFMTNFGQKFGNAINGEQNFESMWHIIIYVKISWKQKFSEAHILWIVISWYQCAVQREYLTKTTLQNSR